MSSCMQKNTRGKPAAGTSSLNTFYKNWWDLWSSTILCAGSGEDAGSLELHSISHLHCWCFLLPVLEPSPWCGAVLVLSRIVGDFVTPMDQSVGTSLSDFGLWWASLPAAHLPRLQWPNSCLSSQQTQVSMYVCMISWCLSTKKGIFFSCKILFEDPSFSNFWKALNSSTWACIFGLMVFTMFDISTCTYMRELFYADGTSVPVQCFQMKMCSILLLCCEMLFHQQASVWAWEAR